MLPIQVKLGLNRSSDSMTDIQIKWISKKMAFYPLVVDWMETNLNTDLQSVLRKGWD